MTKCALILCWVLAALAGSGQKILYCRQTVPSPFADDLQLVANVAGYHHLIFFTADKKPLIQVFDASLQVVGKTEVNVKLKEASDVRLLSLGNFYLMYLHVPGTTVHQFFKVSGEGEAEDVSDLFSAAADTAWNRSTATFQLFNQAASLRLVSHTYFDALKKVGSKIVSFNKELVPVQVQTVFFPFERYADALRQVVLFGNNLLALKTARSEEGSHALEVIKANCVSGDIVSTSFSSGAHFYSGAGFSPIAADSSLYVYSTVLDPASGVRSQRALFVAHLNDSLQESVPSAVLKSTLRSNAANFILLTAGSPHWLVMNNNLRFRVVDRFAGRENFGPDDDGAFRLRGRSFISPEPRIEANQPTAVRFTLLNEHFKPVKDSVIANGGSFYNVQPRPSAQFQLDSKAYLLLIENFSSKQHGLLLLSNDEKGALSTNSLPVFDRYEYLLAQLQPILPNAIILPYAYKNEYGLLKITLTK